MSSFDDLVKLYDKTNNIALEFLKEYETKLRKKKLGIFDIIEKDIQRFKETGNLIYDVDEIISKSSSAKIDEKVKKANTNNRLSSLKENEVDGSVKKLRSSVRPRRNVFGEASQLANIQTTVSQNKGTDNAIVKLERLSEDFLQKVSNREDSTIQELIVKKEMPPPLKPPLRQTRKHRGRQNNANNLNTTDLNALNIKIEQIDAENKKKTLSTNRDSDVVIKKVVVDIINLDDSQEEGKQARGKTRTKARKIQNQQSVESLEQNNEIQTTRVTRTMVRNATKKTESNTELLDNQKRPHSLSDEDVAKTTVKTGSKRTRIDKDSNSKENGEKEPNNTPTSENRNTILKAKDKIEKPNGESVQSNTSMPDCKYRSTRTFIKAKDINDEENKQQNKISISRQEDTNDQTYVKTNLNIDKSDIQNEEIAQNKTFISEYEDALSNPSNDTKVIEESNLISKQDTFIAQATIFNTTVLIEKPQQIIQNETIVISNVFENKKNLANIMTDDDDDGVVVSSPKKKNGKIKQVFSPYQSSPVKQRVQAFEKLQSEAKYDLPYRMTRKQIRDKIVKESTSEANVKEMLSTNITSQGAIPKLRAPSKKNKSIPVLRGTPTTSKLLTHAPISEKSKLPSFENISTISKSAVKASQPEFRERERRQKQKDVEAQSKKETLLQEMTAEKKKKREERQMKVHQTRDALDKHKQKALESIEQLKQEKARQLQAEKEEKLQKQKEEMARKRALAQKKAAEEKCKEEIKRLQQEKIQYLTKKRENLPPYLKYETPLLPTEDCYDTDDSNSGKPIRILSWQKKEKLAKTLIPIRFIHKLKMNLFSNGPTTVNLQQVFPSIEPHKLKRTSSAVWNKSGILTLSTMEEEDED